MSMNYTSFLSFYLIVLFLRNLRIYFIILQDFWCIYTINEMEKTRHGIVFKRFDLAEPAALEA